MVVVLLLSMFVMMCYEYPLRCCSGSVVFVGCYDVLRIFSQMLLGSVVALDVCYDVLRIFSQMLFGSIMFTMFVVMCCGYFSSLFPTLSSFTSFLYIPLLNFVCVRLAWR